MEVVQFKQCSNCGHIVEAAVLNFPVGKMIFCPSCVRPMVVGPFSSTGFSEESVNPLDAYLMEDL